ncbi:endonuclease/exonuclease/phosphatase family protein [Actinoplanes sp. NPDC051633]|uniref:endonuclease/exonuclease/phosphatase family protein n=1 Tax=Actinoplanes sp. NPDC051633 TaxID=3155670 RepID=UPI0034469721
MKVMTWNILVGGGGRLAAIESVVRREKPDILCLQELRGWPRRAPDLGMSIHLSPSVFGQPVAVLVRPPLVLTDLKKTRWRLHHAAASATVGDLTVVSAHLNPFSPYRRYREARWLSARYGSRRRPVLIAGDLNSLDPATDHTATINRLAPAYRRRHLGADGRPDTRAIAAFTAAGFVDLGQGSGASAPTTGLGGPEFSGMRLDYLLASPPLAARLERIEILKDAETDYASDHYPVIAEFS